VSTFDAYLLLYVHTDLPDSDVVAFCCRVSCFLCLPCRFLCILLSSSYALVLSGNHVFTSGAGGTHQAAIRGGLRAEKPELLTVILPQSLEKQPEDGQALLKKVKDLIEMPENDGLPLSEASRICNKALVNRASQLIAFAFHDSSAVLEAVELARSQNKPVTMLFMD